MKTRVKQRGILNGCRLGFFFDVFVFFGCKERSFVGIVYVGAVGRGKGASGRRVSIAFVFSSAKLSSFFFSCTAILLFFDLVAVWDTASDSGSGVRKLARW